MKKENSEKAAGKSKNTSARELPEAELDVMRAVWGADKPLCASEIADGLRERRGWKTATVHVLIDRLCERGYIEADKSGYVHRYKALISADEYRRIESRSFLGRAFGGSLKAMVASLIEDDELTEADVAELSEILNRKTKK